MRGEQCSTIQSEQLKETKAYVIWTSAVRPNIFHASCPIYCMLFHVQQCHEILFASKSETTDFNSQRLKSAYLYLSAFI